MSFFMGCAAPCVAGSNWGQSCDMYLLVKLMFRTRPLAARPKNYSRKSLSSWRTACVYMIEKTLTRSG